MRLHRYVTIFEFRGIHTKLESRATEVQLIVMNRGIHMTDRRTFLKRLVYAAGGLSITGISMPALLRSDYSADFKISLAEWSLHRALFDGKMDHLEFAERASRDFGIQAVEYVNQFFKDKAKDMGYLKTMKKRAEDAGVKSLLIMIDGEGHLGHPEKKERLQTVENHQKWVEAAAYLGCHSIRVNAHSEGTYNEQMKLAADGLRRLSGFADDHDINVIVENHGGNSSDPDWLSGVMEQVSHPRCGTLPDFGNFPEGSDIYEAIIKLMRYARAVSAKSYSFDEEGNEESIDYYRMMRIVTGSGYHGYVGIEYEGDQLSEPEGILATKRLLERVREKLR